MLLTKLINERNYLIVGDSINCGRQKDSFQNSVNQVYEDSSGNYPKYVSKEGYKFLYFYYAQYILERLPEIPEEEIYRNKDYSTLQKDLADFAWKKKFTPSSQMGNTQSSQKREYENNNFNHNRIKFYLFPTCLIENSP